MTRGELLQYLTKEAVKFREHPNFISINKHLTGIDENNIPSKEQIDGVLVAFINSVGISLCIDYALSYKDFEKKELKKIELKSADEYVEVKGLSEIEAEAEELTKELSDEANNLTDFERTLVDICIGWIGEEPGWEQYIKNNADVLFKIAIKKFNSVQDAPFEQKPAWSEEDEQMIKNVQNDYHNRLGAGIIPQAYHDKVIAWLKSLKDRVMLQPKQEWSEEDEEELKVIYAALEEAGQYDSISWLKKSLYSQKPVELSEEDEKSVNIILDICSDFKKVYSYSKTVLKDANKIESFLKSLKERYTWKPSNLPHWKKSTLPKDNTIGFNSDYFCYKGYNINYKELFKKLPKDD